jgi:hypothetical protein
VIALEVIRDPVQCDSVAGFRMACRCDCR